LNALFNEFKCHGRHPSHATHRNERCGMASARDRAELHGVAWRGISVTQCAQCTLGHTTTGDWRGGGPGAGAGWGGPTRPPGMRRGGWGPPRPRRPTKARGARRAEGSPSPPHGAEACLWARPQAWTASLDAAPGDWRLRGNGVIKLLQDSGGIRDAEIDLQIAETAASMRIGKGSLNPRAACGFAGSTNPANLDNFGRRGPPDNLPVGGIWM